MKTYKDKEVGLASFTPGVKIADWLVFTLRAAIGRRRQYHFDSKQVSCYFSYVYAYNKILCCVNSLIVVPLGKERAPNKHQPTFLTMFVFITFALAR